MQRGGYDFTCILLHQSNDECVALVSQPSMTRPSYFRGENRYHCGLGKASAENLRIVAEKAVKYQKGKASNM